MISQSPNRPPTHLHVEKENTGPVSLKASTCADIKKWSFERTNFQVIKEEKPASRDMLNRDEFEECR